MLISHAVVLINSFAGPPALAVNVLRNFEGSSIIVQWNEVDDPLPTNHTVTWSSDETNSTLSDTLIEQSSYTIAGLTLDTVYTIIVTASNRCGAGPEYITSALFPTGIHNIRYVLSTPKLTLQTSL